MDLNTTATIKDLLSKDKIYSIEETTTPPGDTDINISEYNNFSSLLN